MRRKLSLAARQGYEEIGKDSDEPSWTVYHPGTKDYLKRWSAVTGEIVWTKRPQDAERYYLKDAKSLGRSYGPTYEGDPVEVRYVTYDKVLKRVRIRSREEVRAKRKAKRVLKIRLKRRANVRAKLDRLQAENDKLRRTAIACLKRESGQ